MARARRGRPSKGRRDEFRVAVAAHDTYLVHRLRQLHNRDRGEILAAAVVTGLHHLDELPNALVRWHAQPAPIPPALTQPHADEKLPAWVNTSIDGAAQRFCLMLPTVYSTIVTDTATRHAATPFMYATIRSALLWVGLHHLDEIRTALHELDDVQRGDAAGQTALAFYSGELVDTGRSAEEMTRARELLRRATPVAEIVAATGIPAELLTAMSDEITATTATKGEQLDLMSTAV